MKRIAEVKVALAYPVQIGGEMVDTVTIRKKTIRDELDAARASDNPYEQEIYMMAKLTGATTKEIEALDTDQYHLLSMGLESMVQRPITKTTKENS